MKASLPDRSRPLLIYDGECDFCCRWVERWRAVTGDRVAYAPYQTPGLLDRIPGVTREQAEAAVQLVEPDGTVRRGAEAAFYALAHAPRWRWLPAFYRLPGAAPISERVYRFVVRHRELFGRLDRLLLRDPGKPPSRLTWAILLLALGGTYAWLRRRRE